MSPEMYVLIDPNLFHLNIASTTTTISAYPIKYNPDWAIVPYMREEKSTIDAIFSMVKNYFKTWKNIYQECYDVIDAHVNDAFKVAPPSTLPTTGWNATMSLQYFWSARDHVWETYLRHNVPKQPQVLGCVQSTRTPQDPVQAMYRLPGNCNPSKKPVHNPKAPPKCPEPHRTMRPVPAQHWGLGKKTTWQLNVDQSPSLHPRSQPATPHIRNNHFNAKWVHPEWPLSRPCNKQRFWRWHSGHNCRNNQFAHSKSHCANHSHTQQPCNADERVPPTASRN